MPWGISTKESAVKMLTNTLSRPQEFPKMVTVLTELMLNSKSYIRGCQWRKKMYWQLWNYLKHHFFKCNTILWWYGITLFIRFHIHENSFQFDFWFIYLFFIPIVLWASTGDATYIPLEPEATIRVSHFRTQPGVKILTRLTGAAPRHLTQ